MRPLVPLWFSAFLVLILDQFTKLIVLYVLDLKTRGGMLVLDPYLNLRMAWNTGINFGIQLGDKWLLIVLALAICTWVIWWMNRDRPRRIVQISAGMVIGGAIGNVFDRLLYGAVADFLNMSCCGFENPYSFNVADISIFIGAVGLILLTNDAPRTGDSPERSD
ncbi:MAG: signal peptidase II [Silicimonas sp.]|jgi:signal peptidase II|nr:signal peptidase II [Silicimonas sp.]